MATEAQSPQTSSAGSPGAAPQGSTSGQPAEKQGPPPGQNNDLLREHALKAQAAVDRERAGLTIEENRDKLLEGRHQDDEPVVGKGKRGPDGKFQAREAREKALAEAERPADGIEPAEKPEKPTAAVLKHLQDLVANGRADEAAKMIGLDIDKGPRAVEFAKLREQRNKQLALVDQRKAEAAQAYQQVERSAAALEQRYARYAAAEQAFASGDYDRAAQLAWGKTMDEYNRLALSQMATRDPKVAQLEAQLAGFQRQQVQAAQQYQIQQAQAVVEQERAQYVRTLKGELEALEDPRIARAMKKGEGHFIARVFAEQQRAYDASSDTTVSAEEAAELALSAIELDYQSLRSVFDDDSAEEEGPRGAQKPASAGKPAPTRPVRPAKHTNLRSQEAAEANAASRPKPGSRELLEAHIRRTQAALDEERRRVG